MTVNRLIHRHTSPMPSVSWTPHLGGAILELDHADLQPTAGGPVALPASAISFLQAMAAAKLSVRVRVSCGDGAAKWLKSLDGAPLVWYNPVDSVNGTLPRWWTSNYQAAYSDFLIKFLIVLNSYPIVVDYDAGAFGGTIYNEPCLREASYAPNRAAAVAAGYTATADRAMLLSSPTVHLNAAKTANSSVSFYFPYNPYQVINPDKSFTTDVNFTVSLMKEARRVLGDLAVLGNNSYRLPISDLGSGYVTIYNNLKALGGPISLQTATAAKVGDLVAVLAAAAELGAAAVELPTTYYTTVLTFDQADAAAAALQANVPVPPPPPVPDPAPVDPPAPPVDPYVPPVDPPAPPVDPPVDPTPLPVDPTPVDPQPVPTLTDVLRKTVGIDELETRVKALEDKTGA